MKRRCPREVALVPKQVSKIVEARRRKAMLRAEYLFADRQRSLEKRPCRREVALTLKKDGEIVQARRSTEMLWALLAVRQRSLDKRPTPAASHARTLRGTRSTRGSTRVPYT